jgi:hypothetical protein
MHALGLGVYNVHNLHRAALYTPGPVCTEESNCLFRRRSVVNGTYNKDQFTRVARTYKPRVYLRDSFSHYCTFVMAGVCTTYRSGNGFFSWGRNAE